MNRISAAAVFLLLVLVGGGAQTNGHFGAAHMAAAEIAPIYNASGTLQASSHTVIGSGTLSASALTVTFSGAAVFTSSSTYVCNAMAVSALDKFTAIYTSGTSVTFQSDSPSDPFTYSCTGN